MIAASVGKAAVIGAVAAGAAFIAATEAAIQELAAYAAELVVDSILTENPILKAEKEQENVGKEKTIREKNALVDKLVILQPLANTNRVRDNATVTAIITDVNDRINRDQNPIREGDHFNATKEGSGAIAAAFYGVPEFQDVPNENELGQTIKGEDQKATDRNWFNLIEAMVKLNLNRIAEKRYNMKKRKELLENTYKIETVEQRTKKYLDNLEATPGVVAIRAAVGALASGIALHHSWHPGGGAMHPPVANWNQLVQRVPNIVPGPAPNNANKKIYSDNIETRKSQIKDLQNGIIRNDPNMQNLVQLAGGAGNVPQQNWLNAAFPNNIEGIIADNHQKREDAARAASYANVILANKQHNMNFNNSLTGDIVRFEMFAEPYEKTLNDLKDTIDKIKKADDDIAGVNKTISDIIEIGGDSSSNVFMTPLAFAKEVSSRIANFNRDRGDTKPPLSGKLYTALKFMIAVDDSFYTILDGDNFDNMAPNHKEKYCKAIDDLIASGNLAITADTALDKIKDKSEDDKKIANADDNDITLSQWLLALNSIYAKIKKKFERELEQGSENLKGTELTIEATRRIKTEVEKYNNKNTPELIEAANKVFSTARRAGVGGGKANLGTLVAIDLIIKVIRDNILEQKDKNYKLEDIDSIVEKIGSVEKIKEVKENNKNAAGKKGKKNHLTDTTQIAKIKNWMESDAVYDTDYKQFKIRFPKIKLSKEAYEDQFK
jgi:hypothetical protein